MHLVQAAEKSFARHETFHPRYGWFRKAFAFVTEDPRIFLRKDATVRLGVGKNMVRAIRFWGIAAKLIEDDPDSPNRRTPNLRPTRLGHDLFDDTGWDPYMEDPGTLWLLHWLLLAPKSWLPVWWLAFHEFHAVEFTEGDLESAISVQLDGADWPKPHPSSIKKDIGALLRTYAPADQAKRTSIDDILDCPLRELNLIGRSAATDGYRFTLGVKPSLPPAILAFATLDYMRRIEVGGHTVTLTRLAHEAGGPGKAFKLTEGEMLQTIEPVIDQTQAVQITAVAGAPQLSWTGDLYALSREVLSDYYRSSDATRDVAMLAGSSKLDERPPAAAAAAGGRR